MMTLKELKEQIKTEENVNTLKKWITYYETFLNDNSVSLVPLINYLITHKMSGKMEDMHSLSTSCMLNSFCNAYRSNPDWICNKCYAFDTLERYPSLKWKLALSTILLTTTILRDQDIPFINYFDFRLEAFGDLNNEIQVVNYFNVARKNKHLNITLYTKNPFIIASAMEKYNVSKPDNMIIVYSEKILNFIPDDEYLNGLFEKYPFIDKIFIVYTDENARQYLITRNRKCFYCKLHCNTCKFCYRKSAPEDPKVIIELEKSEMNKVKKELKKQNKKGSL